MSFYNLRGDSLRKANSLGGDFIGHCEKNVRLNKRLSIVNKAELLESPNLTLLDFSLWGWMMSEVYKRNMDTRDEFLARMLDAPARTKNREDQLRRTTRDFRTRIAKCTEVGGAIFESLL
jgi:hypothetical protein